MGKRSEFERNPRDFYPTPVEAVLPLLPYVSGAFVEPCAGDGALVLHLEAAGLHCAAAFDIEPQNPNIEKCNLFDWSMPDRMQGAQFITNPPWERHMLHKIITHLRVRAPTWLLFDADWMHTKQAAPHLHFCDAIISVGRVSWMSNGTSGMDNCAWYHFVDKSTRWTTFIGQPVEKTCPETLPLGI